MKILLLDIETAPNTAHVWGLWKENIPIQRLISSGYVLCWAAKWLGDSIYHFGSVEYGNNTGMLHGIHDLLEEADAVVHFNGSNFDIPTLNKEFLLHKIDPPSPYKHIDLLKVVRQQFRFPSNKLEYVARELGLTQKVKHAGYQLWLDCMAGIPEAWKEMEKYNVGDIVTLEELYHKLRPWIRNHPNHSLDTTDPVCPTCGSNRLHRRGTYRSNSAIYNRFRCVDCGSWSRSIKSSIKRTMAVAL